MAEASVMNIDSETLRNKITCTICSKHFSTPKTLPCLHSFCLACLAAISTENDFGTLHLTCPECKKEFPSIGASLVDLPDAFQVNRHLEYHKFKQKALGQVNVHCEKCVGKKIRASGFCSKCTQFICDLCIQIHSSWSELKDHKTLKLSELKESYEKYVPVLSAKQTCHIHDHESTIFCETCEILICHECILKSHRDHEYFHSVESAKKHKKETIEHLDSIHHLPVQLHTAIAVIDTIMERYSNQGQDIKTKLKEALDNLERLLAQQREELNTGLSERLNSKLQLLTDQKQSLEHMMRKISNCIGFVNETVENKHVVEYFILEKQMLKRISELHTEFTQLDLQPIEEPEAHFSFNKDSLENIKETFQVTDGSVLHGSSRIFTVSEVICFYISLSSSFYKTKNNPMDELKAEIQSMRDGSVCPATVAVSSNGFAKLQCSFSERGRYAVSVRIGGKHINGSPYHFYIKPNGSQLQKPIKSITKLQVPKALAISNKHEIIVCEENAHAVTVYGRKSKKVLTIGQYGKNKGQFSHPTGVAVDQDGCIYVVDTKNDRVQKFDKEGTFLGEYKGEKEKNNQLHLPSSIKIGPDDHIYIVDRGNARVVILNKEMEYISSFGSAGYGLGSLHDPWDLAFDENGFIYITDRRQHCIQIFTPNGAFRGKIGSQGQQKGKLNHPAGIAIDRFGKIYVCESGNHRVSIFHISSEFIECFSIGLSMVNPCGIAVDKDGFMYVASDETVHVF